MAKLVQHSRNNATRYIFKDLVLDVQRGTLSRNGEAIALPKLSYDLLVALVKSAPALMSQQQLMDVVWPERVIGDETLKQRVKLLRKALGDDASAPIYIEALRGRGYRLIPPVKPECIVQRPPSVMLEITANDLMSNILANDVRRLWRKIAQTGAILLLIILAVLLVNEIYLNNIKLDEPSVSQPKVVNDTISAAEILYNRGVEYYQRYRAQDIGIAINFFKQALAIQPKYSDAYAGLSQAYSQLFFQFGGNEQDKIKAIDNAYRAISYDENSAEAYKALGSAYYVSGWLSKSINALLRAYSKGSINKDILSNLAFIYSEQGNFKQALVWHQRALTVAPNDAVAALHLGITLERLGHIELAQKWYKKALVIQPDYSLAGYHFAQSLCLYKQPAQGVALIEMSIEKYGPDYLSMLAKSHCYFYLGQKEKAVALYQSIKSKYPNRQPVNIDLVMINVSRQDLLSQIENYESLLNKGSGKAFHSVNLALLYNSLGQADKVLRYLVQAVEQGGRLPQEILSYPFDEKVRSSQVYQDLLKRHEKAMTRYQQLDISFFLRT
ncbi:winged helix-turn-helix domain-containing protein [Thalassotalea ganghwensis]